MVNQLAALTALIEKHPRIAGSLLQTYNDLDLAQQWQDLEVLDLPKCARGAFRGRRPGTDATLAVVPCAIAEGLSLSLLSTAFEELGSPPELYLAITTEDSSIVYYKLSRGIIKPPM